tara:strand:+ start:2163 stop:2723 length:561 start_codon:yes stop_codon:yes gene_type:complete
LSIYKKARIFLFFFLLSIASCSSSETQLVMTTEGVRDVFTETAMGVTLNFSEFGQSKLMLKAPKLVRFEDQENQLIMECPSGLELTFYDSLKNVESVLTADYGKLFTQNQLLDVQENVVFHNQKQDTLFAKELLIDFAKDSIYSKNEVTFSNIEGRITGNKLKANSNFTFFELSDISESHVNYKME